MLIKFRHRSGGQAGKDFDMTAGSTCCCGVHAPYNEKRKKKIKLQMNSENLA